MKFYQTLILASLVALLCSCGATKKIPYAVEAETIPASLLEQVEKASEPVAMPGDLLDIIVSSANVDAVKPFNRLDLITQLSSSAYTNQQNDQNKTMYYLVDSEGYIEFPVLGRLQVAGMNKEQIKGIIMAGIYPRYLTEQPGIDIRFKDYKVSVLGEVKSPGVYKASNERLTIFEAIAMAGDLNITGRRDNVMLIRTDMDGTRSIHRIDLNDKDIMLSPYYNLQQNDVIYVQPNASRARAAWSIPPGLSLTLSSIGTLVSIATLIVTITRN